MSYTIREIKRRVASIEQGRATGKLNKAELVELATLEAEHDRFFPVPVDEMDGTQVDDAIDYLVGRVGSTERLEQLRRRNGFFDDMEEIDHADDG